MLHEITDSWKAFVIVLFQRFGIRSNGSGFAFETNCQRITERQVSVEKKLSAAVRTARSIRSKKLVIRLNGSSFRCSKLLSPDHLSRLRRKENGNVVNSSKRCLPSPHEFSRYIFCWIALLASIAFDYCYTFYSRLKACLHGGGEPKGEVTRLSI